VKKEEEQKKLSKSVDEVAIHFSLPLPVHCFNDMWTRL